MVGVLCHSLLPPADRRPGAGPPYRQRPARPGVPVDGRGRPDRRHPGSPRLVSSRAFAGHGSIARPCVDPAHGPSRGFRRLPHQDCRPWTFETDPRTTAFRAEVRAWLEDHLVGEFAAPRGRPGRIGRRDARFETRLAWEKELAAGRLDRASAGPASAAAGAPDRPAGDLQRGVRDGPTPRPGSGVLGEGLIGPTLIALRHRGPEGPLPRRRSDGHRALVPGLLRARRRSRTWPTSRPRPTSTATSGSITGQKVWTS